jgi:bifunctional enzyme CysN/CysC
MIVHAENLPIVASHFEAMVIWLSDTPLNRRTTYLLRHTSRTTNARISGIEFRVDVNTMAKQSAEVLHLNEIGRASLATHLPLFFDSYRDNRETGNFILIDPISNNTVAAGMIERPQATVETAPLETRVDRREYLWERGLVSSEARIGRNQHRGKTVLFIGPARSGKRDLARRLELALFEKGRHAYYLGVSSMLEGLEADIGQNFRDREEHIRRLGELARIMTDAGLIFISSLERADEIDLQRLKILNSPNELFVVSVGDHAFKNYSVDVVLPAGQSPGDAVQTVVRELTRAQVIIEYYI